jgi:elongation factor Ts
MSEITAERIKELRELTGAKILDCKKALEGSGGDIAKAADALRAKGMAKGAERSSGARTTAEGQVGSYIHANGKIGVLVEVSCETDFVARNEAFQDLVREVAMQIAAMNPLAVDRDALPPDEVAKQREAAANSDALKGKPDNVKEKIASGMVEKWFKDVCLVDQPYIKDDKQTIKNLVDAVSGKIGEAIRINRFVRFQLGG